MKVRGSSITRRMSANTALLSALFFAVVAALGFDPRPAIAASCSDMGVMWEEHGDGTVTDCSTALRWEMKTSDGTINDVNNTYSWSTVADYLDFAVFDGTAATVFLAGLNGSAFAGHAGWRLPNYRDLEDIVDISVCPPGACTTIPGETKSGKYWSPQPWSEGLANPTCYAATSFDPGPPPHNVTPKPCRTWVDFSDGVVNGSLNTDLNAVRAVQTGSVLSRGNHTSWGSPDSGQIGSMPFDDLVDYSNYYTAANGLKPDGSIVAWGYESDGQITGTPTGTGYTDVASTYYTGFAINASGEIEGWGKDEDSEISSIPAGNNFVSIVGGYYAGFALDCTGKIYGWGREDSGQFGDIPTGDGFTKIATWYVNVYALAADGTIAAWGYDDYKQVSSTPTGTGYVDIAASTYNGFAVASDGSIHAWGWDEDDCIEVANTGAGCSLLDDVPAGNDFVAVAATDYTAFALRSDGTIAAWGQDSDGEVGKAPTTGTYASIYGMWYGGTALESAPPPITWCLAPPTFGGTTSGAISVVTTLLMDPTTPRLVANKLQRAKNKLELALARYNEGKTTTALRNLKRAVGRLEDAITRGLAPSSINPTIDDLVAFIRQQASDEIDAAIARGGRAGRISTAQDLLAQGDAQTDRSVACARFVKAFTKAKRA